MHITKFSTWKRLGFGSFLQEDEGVAKVFRRPLFFVVQRMILWGALLGGLTWGAWFFLPPDLFWAWWGLGALTGYKLLAIFCHWYVNGIVMTTDNVIDVEWPRFFERRCTRVDYWDLDEIEVERVGIKSFIYNYGTLRLQKYGGELHAIHMIYRPNKAARIIEKYREQMVDAKNFTEESALKDLITKLVRTHVRDHGQPERPDKEGRRSNKEEIPKKSFIKNVFKPQTTSIEVEKELDDEGGIEIDLDSDK
ncbi:hypothetical protein K9M41_01030 [Candidatus Gracilibacteria bacterium]|nr:hypothetical protein [Candidatus Gracilibacteria bacterium]